MMATRPFACLPIRRGQAICAPTSWQSKLGPCEAPETRPFRGAHLRLTAEKRASLYIPPPSHCPSCPPVGFSRLFMVVGLSRYAALRSCAWLCVFKDWQTRDQLVRTDMESEVGWFRMSHRLPAVVDNAAAAGASGAGGGAAHA